MIPTLETERLVLRAPGKQDLDALVAFGQSERTRHVGGMFSRHDAFTRLAAMIGHWDLRGFGRWVLDAKDGETSLGTVGPFYPDGWPEPELAWTMWQGEGMGYAFEAAMAARSFAYETLGWKTAVSLIDPENNRSVALGKRMGVQFERNFEHPHFGTLAVWRHPSPEDLQ